MFNFKFKFNEGVWTPSLCGLSRENIYLTSKEYIHPPRENIYMGSFDVT